MSKFYIPANSPEDWKHLLAEPEKQWKSGYSAKSLAYCWQESDDFPKSVKMMFTNSNIPLFQNIELIVAFPEYKVVLPGGRRASQNDIFCLGKAADSLVSIMVEGKISESFGEIIKDWKSEYTPGKQARLGYLCELLGIDAKKMDTIRYQLVHRTASAVMESKKFNAQNALMLVHSFSQNNDGFDDYCQFLALFGVIGKINDLVFAKNINGIGLYFSWVRDNFNNTLQPGTKLYELVEAEEKYGALAGNPNGLKK
jgi:hypothetical protein